MDKKQKKEHKRKKFKETKVGSFLIEKFPDIAEKALEIAEDFNLPGAGTLKTIFSNTAGVKQEDRVAFSEAMANYEIEAKKINLELEKIFLEAEKVASADRDSARKREVELTKAEGASWLAKNIVPLLAIAWTLFTMVLFILAMNGKIDAKENMQFLVINSVTNIVMLIVGYYFGSSAGSAKKQQHIESQEAKKG